MDIRGRLIGLEELEARIAPAGGVVVTQAGGNLTITGDVEANDLVITQVDDDEFQMTSGGDATTINGEAGPIVFHGVTKDIKFAMKDGNDVITMSNLTIAGNLTVDAGNGDNTLAANGMAVAKAVTVKGGLGFDTVEFDGTTGADFKVTTGVGGSDLSIVGSIGKNLSVKSGDGGDTVYLKGAVAQNASLSLGASDNDVTVESATIGGNVVIKALEGELNVDIVSAQTGKVTINHSGGDSGVSIVSTDIFGNLAIKTGEGPHTMNIRSTSTVSGSVSIMNGAGSSSTLVEDAMIGGALSVKNAGGTSDTSISGASVVKATAITNGHGYDAISIGGSTLRGGFAIKTGDGGSAIELGETYVGCDHTFTGPFYGLTIQAGAGGNGIDLIVAVGGKTSIASTGSADIDVEDSTLIENVTMKTGNGADTISLLSSELWRGTLTMDTGGGDDNIRMDDVDAEGLVVKAGAGNDTLEIATQGEPGDDFTDIDGPMTAFMGDGDDTVVIGIDGQEYNSVYIGGLPTADGGAGNDSISAGDENYFELDGIVRNFETEDIPVQP